jgi:hypothetical protein
MANITSAGSYRQPAATQRFYLPAADVSGTWAKGAGGNAADFTQDTATGIYSPTANLGDGTAQIVKTLPLVFTPADGSGSVTQTVTITLTTVAAPASASLSYVGDFTGTAGRQLETLPGWAISGGAATALNTPQTDGTGGLIGTTGHEDNAGQWACLYTPSGSINGDTITFTVSKADVGSNDYGATRFMVGASGFQNSIFFGMYTKNTSIDYSPGISRRQGSTVTPLPGIVSGASGYRVDGTADVIFSFSPDGNTLTVTVVGNTTATKTIDMTGTTKGTSFGFGGPAAYAETLQLGKHVKAISFVRPVTTLALTDAPTYSVTNQATYTATWSGTKPTQLRHRFKNDVGTYVTPWMVGDTLTNTGTTSGTITYLATAPSGGGLTIEIAPLNDIAVVAVAATPTYFLANVTAFQQGYNVRGPDYSTPVPWDNNWGPCCEVQPNFIYMPYDGIEGYANLTITPPSTVITGQTSDITIISNDGAGHIRVNIAQSSTGARHLTWSGSTPTSLNVVRDGVTGRTPAEWINGVRGQWVRDLDASATNTVPLNSDQVYNTPSTPFWKNDIGNGGQVPYQIVVDAIAAKMAADPNFVAYWGVLPADVPLEGVGVGSVRDRAKYEAATLPTRAKRAIELFNEFPWNGIFNGVRRGLLDAVRKGYYGAATLGNLQPAINVRGEDGGPPETLITTADVASGDYIIANIYKVGDAVYRAKQFAPSGTHVAGGTTGAPTENAYFTKLAIDIPLAGRKYHMARMKAVLDIYRQEWGDARFNSQIVPVLMGQAGGGLYAQLADHRAFDPATFALIKGTGYGYYFSPQAGQNPATVTSAQIEASMRANMPSVQQSVRQAVTDSLRMGKIPMFYEGMKGPDDSLYHSPSNYYTQWNALMASDAGRAIMSDIAFFMKSTVPGVAMGYDLVGTLEWSLMKTWRDTANKCLVGYLEGLARVPTPPSPPPAPPPSPTPSTRPSSFNPIYIQIISGV